MGETGEVHLSGKTHVESSESEEKQTLTNEQWRQLLQAAIQGNGIFPQAYLAQGVLLANRMAQLSRESQIPLIRGSRHK